MKRVLVDTRVWFAVVWALLVFNAPAFAQEARSKAETGGHPAAVSPGPGGRIATPKAAPPEVFGHSFLSPSSAENRPPPVTDATVISVGDTLQIQVLGEVRQAGLLVPNTYTCPVKETGFIQYPLIGSVQVSGMSFGEVQAKLKGLITRKLTGGDNVSPSAILVSIAGFHRIWVQGDGHIARRGNFSYAYGTTLRQVLSRMQPEPDASLRSIQVWTNGTKRELDLYPSLLKYMPTNLDIDIKDGSRIYVPGIREAGNKEVTVHGAVERPMAFEVKPGETVAQVLDMAILSSRAYTANFQVARIVPNNGVVGTIVSFPEAQREEPHDGDVITVKEVSGVVINMAQVLSHDRNHPVLRMEGGYPVVRGSTRVSDLLEYAMPTVDASDRATLFTRETNASTGLSHATVRPVLIREAMKHDPTYDLLVQDGDSLVVYGRREFSPAASFSIVGEVVRPVNDVPLPANLTVSRAIFQFAGGLKADADTAAIEVARVGTAPDSAEPKILSIMTAIRPSIGARGTTDPDGDVLADSLVVRNGDRIIVHKNPAFLQGATTVQVQGSVVRPGTYARTSRMRLSDVLKKAQLRSNADTARVAVIAGGDTIVVAAELALAHPGAEQYDLAIPPNAVVAVPEKPDYVTIVGPKNVVRSGKMQFVPGWPLENYLEVAVLDRSKVNLARTTVTDRNGTIHRARRRLTHGFARQYPAVTAGSTVRIYPKD